MFLLSERHEIVPMDIDKQVPDLAIEQYNPKNLMP